MPTLLFATLLAACQGTSPPPPPPKSACQEQRFEGAGFIVCRPASPNRLRLIAAGAKESPKRAFRDIGLDPRHVAFAMNAGMFGEDGRPIGLAVVDGDEKHKISLREGGGNFGMKPNGVFLIRASGKAEIVVSEDYEKSDDIRLATQSGPMLLIDGKLHPQFKPNGESINIRNGVGIGPDGTPLFVIAADPVSFGRMARFYRDRLNARDALYFDGSVSSLWDPANGRMDVVTDLGPIIVATK